jgi:hypothetical protein
LSELSPRRPESNAHIQRFNRTIKEQFVYKNEDRIGCCELANQKKIKDHFFWYKGQETIFNQRQEVKDFIANYRKNRGQYIKKDEIKPLNYTLAILKHQNV